MFNNPVTQRITDYLVSHGAVLSTDRPDDELVDLLRAARAELQNYELMVRPGREAKPVPQVFRAGDARQCTGCGKWVRNKTFFGTLHVCSEE